MALSQGGKTRALCRQTAATCCSRLLFGKGTWQRGLSTVCLLSIQSLSSASAVASAFCLRCHPCSDGSVMRRGDLPWSRHQEGYLLSVGTSALVFQFYREELEREQASRARVEQDLDEATQRLLMAQEEIRRLAAELDAQRKEQSKTGKCFSRGHSSLLACT